MVYREDSYMCDECYADTYYTKDQETSLGICSSCPANTVSPPGSRSQRNCVCKPGFVSESMGAYNSYTCTACSAGTFSSTANSSRCYLCVSGKIFSNVGASSEAACTDCPSGTVALQAEMSVCVPCPPSTCQDMAAAGHMSTPCSPCPVNSYHDLSWVSNVFWCTCAPGMYKSPNWTHSFVCTKCEPGFSYSATSVSVVMSITLGISLSVEEFSPALQLDFRETVAASVDVDVSRAKIISISEQASSCRLLIILFRRLLSSIMAVEFEIILDSTTGGGGSRGRKTRLHFVCCPAASLIRSM